MSVQTVVRQGVPIHPWVSERSEPYLPVTVFFDAHIHVQPGQCFPPSVGGAPAEKSFFCANAIRQADWVPVLEQSARSALVLPFLGIHPWYAGEVSTGWDQELETLLRAHGSAGIGEVGLDRCCAVSLDRQLQVFQRQLHLAVVLERAVSIHCVRAWGVLVEILEPFSGSGARMMVHSFSGSAEIMHRLTRMGIYISFSPFICTMRGRSLFDVIRQVPEHLLLLESDAPDQLPLQSSQGDWSANYHQTMASVYRQVGALRGVPLERLKERVKENGAVFTNTKHTG